MIRRLGWIAVALFGIYAAIGIGPASAQDPRGSVVQKEARGWLALTDHGDASASWRASGKKFQGAITEDQWTAALREVRPPLGELTDRTLISTQFTNSFPGSPDGEYALLVFRSSFVKKVDVHETVTLEREGDGAWHVIGYFIH